MEGGEKKRKGGTEGCPEREVVVSSKEGHTPDHRLRHKDMTLCSDRSSLRRDSQRSDAGAGSDHVITSL